MLQLIEDAGWGVYPVLLFGLGMLGTAAIYAVVPKPRFLPLLGTFLVSTLMSGAMGTLRGIQNSALDGREADGSMAVFFQNFPDDLICLQIAIGITFIAMLMTMVGAARYAARDPVGPPGPKGSTKA